MSIMTRTGGSRGARGVLHPVYGVAVYAIAGATADDSGSRATPTRLHIAGDATASRSSLERSSSCLR